MADGLSEKQQRILAFVERFLDEHDYPPSIRDIQQGCDISSTSVVDYNLKRLEERGLLRRDREISRAIQLPGAQSRWTSGKDLSWHPLRPELVVEVGYDAMEGNRFRHTAQFKRWRTDRSPESCTYDQLERPVTYSLTDVFMPSELR